MEGKLSVFLLYFPIAQLHDFDEFKFEFSSPNDSKFSLECEWNNSISWIWTKIGLFEENVFFGKKQNFSLLGKFSKFNVHCIPGLTSPRHLELISYDSNISVLFQCGSLLENLWTALVQLWTALKIKISQLRINAEQLFQLWFSLKQCWFRTEQRWFSLKQRWVELIFK